MCLAGLATASVPSWFDYRGKLSCLKYVFRMRELTRINLRLGGWVSKPGTADSHQRLIEDRPCCDSLLKTALNQIHKGMSSPFW